MSTHALARISSRPRRTSERTERGRVMDGCALARECVRARQQTIAQKLALARRRPPTSIASLRNTHRNHITRASSSSSPSSSTRARRVDAIHATRPCVIDPSRRVVVHRENDHTKYCRVCSHVRDDMNNKSTCAQFRGLIMVNIHKKYIFSIRPRDHPYKQKSSAQSVDIAYMAQFALECE